MELNTISDSKQLFYKEFPYVIPHIFRKVVDEILVELHLLKHQKDFTVDSLFAIGLSQIFTDFTAGYKPEEHLENLFNAICISTKIDPSAIRTEATKALLTHKQIGLKEINEIRDNNHKELEALKGSNKIYNRITLVGIYTIVDNIIKNEIDSEGYDLKEITLRIAKSLGFPQDRIDKDITQYLASINKIKQALELIDLLNKKKK